MLRRPFAKGQPSYCLCSQALQTKKQGHLRNLLLPATSAPRFSSSSTVSTLPPAAAAIDGVKPS